MSSENLLQKSVVSLAFERQDFLSPANHIFSVETQTPFTTMAVTKADNASATASAAPLSVDGEIDQPLAKDRGSVDSPYEFKQDYRFWSIIFALCTMQFLCSLENTVVVTSLPTIVKELNFGSSYIWVTNIFFLSTLVLTRSRRSASFVSKAC